MDARPIQLKDRSHKVCLKSVVSADIRNLMIVYLSKAFVPLAAVLLIVHRCCNKRVLAKSLLFILSQQRLYYTLLICTIVSDVDIGVQQSCWCGLNILGICLNFKSVQV